jgi:radical SAM superfamily enzyme YgiQ (UPF0313 family)
MVDAIRAACAAKKHVPRAPVVLGGFHASIYPEESLRSSEAFDVVVAGEAEERFPRLVERLLDGGFPSDIPGVSYRRDDGSLHVDALNPFVADLDALAPPDRRMVDYRAHRCILGEPRLTTLILSSRGCPFPCEYCYVNIKQYRERGVDRVLDEIRDCLSLGIEDFFFTDDLFNLRRERVIDFSERVLADKLKIRWSFRGRVDQIDEETAGKARAAGCTRIHFGVETGDPAILKRIGKKTDLGMVRRSIEITRRAGIEVSVNFMIGLPGETAIETERTIRFALSLPADYLQAAVFTPYPKTAAYRRALADGLFAEDYWRAFALKPVPGFASPVWPEHYTREELMEKLRRFYRRFYLRPRIIMKTLGRLRDPAAWRQWFENFRTFLALVLASRSRKAGSGK